MENICYTEMPFTCPQVMPILNIPDNYWLRRLRFEAKQNTVRIPILVHFEWVNKLMRKSKQKFQKLSNIQRTKSDVLMINELPGWDDGRYVMENVNNIVWKSQLTTKHIEPNNLCTCIGTNTLEHVTWTRAKGQVMCKSHTHHAEIRK